MIQRQYPNLMATYQGVTEELAYDRSVEVLKWGVCVGYKEMLSVKIDDLLHDESMSLGMASYTKSRWTRFLRRYFREDIGEWIDESMDKLNRYPKRPFVASYSVNLNTGHNYGGCLASLQIRIAPYPEVILVSRACHLDKVGFLDLALMNVVARRMLAHGTITTGIRGSWVASNCFISAISQIFYLKMFDKPVAGHRLESTLHRLIDVDYDAIKFGPLKRGRKRMQSLDEVGYIPNSILVKDLSIQPAKFHARGGVILPKDGDLGIGIDPAITTATDEFLEEMGLD